MDDRIWKQSMAGAALVVLGCVLLGAQAGWYDIGGVTRLWPLALVVVGLSRGILTRDGFLWSGWGGLLLMWTTGVWPLGQSWPLFLVLHGLAMLFWRDAHDRQRGDGSRVA